MPKLTGRLSLMAAVLATVAIAACEDGDITGVLTPEDGLLQSMDGSVQATGGGRVDFPTGGPNKQSKSKHYQTWGFNIQDSDGTGPNGPSGRLQVVDHREEVRSLCGGNPCQFHSIEFTFLGTAPECTGEGSAWIEGTVEERNTSARYQFELAVCDNGEPGAKGADRDRFEFLVRDLIVPAGHGDDDNQYCLFQAGLLNDCRPDPGAGEAEESDDARGALLTGGNIQAHS